MDDREPDQSLFKTPMLTPVVSDVHKPDEYADVQCSITQTDYQQVADFTRNLEARLNLNYLLNENDYDSEAESDTHEKRPTEATDDSNDPNHLQKYPVEKTLDKSLHPQTSQEHDYSIHPCVQETISSQESFSGIMPNVDTDYETRSTTVCGESFCVPYTIELDENDEILLMKEASTTYTTEYIEPKKNKNDIGHIMISYNHSTKALCSKIARELKNLNYLVWIDQDNISGDILTSMASAVENSYVVLMAINEQYYQSRYCRLEAEYSVERNKASIPMLMQSGYKAAGWLGIINGSKLHIDFSQLSFDEAFILLRREIEAVRIALGADVYDRTSSTQNYNNNSITTMSSSWTSTIDVHEWSADDVIEWLNREKLEIFQNSLSRFTGPTLWQLYKIKFDSATDYYRTVESLLPPTTSDRLFYILTFNAALESLFSSPHQSIHRH
ncbi:unnamed protein product [Rotaria sordida]|uniref:TIR domain-containing protein n=1 Tax=Rotaria sordida TaxID=392033 RepID=A0A814JGL9_9BILA|nr:unnamed protein product [Rotaria sordida]CAF1039060.1 unnamed protein product [Rotaria sordida]